MIFSFHSETAFAVDCMREADRILVRALIGDRFQNVPLAACPAAIQVAFIGSWWCERRAPILMPEQKKS